MPRELHSMQMRISEGDERAFREMFEHYSPRVYSFAIRLTHSREMAEEIVQETFVKIWSSRRTLSQVEHFPAYLYTITRNLAFNALKRIAVEQRVKATLVRELRVESTETEESIIYRDYQRFLRGAIDRLSPQQRMVYSLCHGEGLKYEEAAKKLRISRLTVKTHMQQALRSIKVHMNQIIATLSLLVVITG